LSEFLKSRSVDPHFSVGATLSDIPAPLICGNAYGQDFKSGDCLQLGVVGLSDLVDV
jgi:hypothetical protein